MSSDTLEQLRLAAYENWRLGVLNLYEQKPKAVGSDLLYCVLERVSPYGSMAIWDENGVDPFEGLYAVSSGFIDDVGERIDDLWQKRDKSKYLSFYDLEGIFGRDQRISLIRAIELFKIQNKFDDEIYAALTLEVGAPSEANHLSGKISIQKIYDRFEYY